VPKIRPKGLPSVANFFRFVRFTMKFTVFSRQLSVRYKSVIRFYVGNVVIIVSAGLTFGNIGDISADGPVGTAAMLVMGLPPPRLLIRMLSCEAENGRTTVRPYSTIDSLFDLRNKRVTIWKNIL